MAEKGVNGAVKEGKPESIENVNKRIKRQLEYYFGDINLPKDRFLQEQIKLDDGWVPLDVMLKFKRLSSLTTDTNVIVSALESSDLIQVSPDKKKIRRNPSQPLPVLNEERRKELVSRTVYCKGFPAEACTLDQLLDFFGTFGPIDNVQMRSYKDQTKKAVFKGSVFVTFKTRELAAQFLEKDANYGDVKLIKKWQNDYLEEKRKERLEKKTPKKNTQQKDQPKELPLGAILHLKGINGETTRDDIRDKFIKEGLDVAFIQFTKGDDEVWIRFLGENSSKNFVEKIKDTKFEICGTEVEARCLEGEEEETYLEKTRQALEKKKQFDRSRRDDRKDRFRGGRRGGRGGRYGKRKGSPVRGDPPPKKDDKAKAEEAEAETKAEAE